MINYISSYHHSYHSLFNRLLTGGQITCLGYLLCNPKDRMKVYDDYCLLNNILFHSWWCLPCEGFYILEMHIVYWQSILFQISSKGPICHGIVWIRNGLVTMPGVSSGTPSRTGHLILGGLHGQFIESYLQMTMNDHIFSYLILKAPQNNRRNPRFDRVLSYYFSIFHPLHSLCFHVNMPTNRSPLKGGRERT